MLCPPKNKRKFRCRSARHACESPTSGSASTAAELDSALISVELLILRLNPTSSTGSSTRNFVESISVHSILINESYAGRNTQAANIDSGVEQKSVSYRSGIIRFPMKQQLPSSSIPRRPRGAVESMLDDALESGERKPNRPAKPLLIWSLLLSGGLIFYRFCLRDGAMFRSDAGWFLMIFAGGFLFAADRNFPNRAWWAFMPWGAALLLELRLESAAELAFQRSTAPLLSQYAAAASEFLVFMLLWIVFLPGVRRPDYISSSLWRDSQAILLLIGCGRIVPGSRTAQTPPYLDDAGYGADPLVRALVFSLDTHHLRIARLQSRLVPINLLGVCAEQHRSPPGPFPLIRNY